MLPVGTYLSLSLSLSLVPTKKAVSCIFFLIRFSLKIRASICPFTSNKVIYFNRPLPNNCVYSPKKVPHPQKRTNTPSHIYYDQSDLPVSLSLFCFSNSVFLIIFPLLTSGHCCSLSQQYIYYRDNSKGEERERRKMDLSGHQGEIPIPMTTTYIPSHKIGRAHV